jgi:hypothetical protein
LISNKQTEISNPEFGAKTLNSGFVFVQPKFVICSNWLNHPEATELAIFGSKVNRGYKEVN